MEHVIHGPSDVEALEILQPTVYVSIPWKTLRKQLVWRHPNTRIGLEHNEDSPEFSGFLSNGIWQFVTEGRAIAVIDFGSMFTGSQNSQSSRRLVGEN